MNINDVKIGQRVCWKGNKYEEPDSGVVTGFRFNHADTAVWVTWDSDKEEMSILPEEIELEHVPTQSPSLANTKIDVQKYTDTYGITLEQAHQEVQNWLFEQGYNWSSAGHNVSCTFARWIEVGVIKGYSPTHLTWSDGGYSTAKEITLLRNVSVSISIAHPEPSVELDGKQYTKTQLLDALAKLEGK